MIAALAKSQPREVCRCIEQFVEALYQLPGGQKELRVRATLIESRCGDGSDYDQARSQALRSYRGKPQRLTASSLAIQRLRELRDTPLFLIAEVDLQCQQIETVLDEGILKLSPSARRAFLAWRKACRNLQKESEARHVDGCWYLYHVHQAGEEEATKDAKSAAAITQTECGRANFKEIKAAADSLVSWVQSDFDHTAGGGANTSPCHAGAHTAPKDEREDVVRIPSGDATDKVRAGKERNDKSFLPELMVDTKLLQARYSGVPYNLTDAQATGLKAVVDARGDWVSWSGLGITKPSDAKESLPEELKALIESSPGKGYRLKRLT